MGVRRRRPVHAGGQCGLPLAGRSGDAGRHRGRGRPAGGTEEGAYRYSEVEYASIGANARFNFGDTSPVYGLVRAGYWAAEENELGDRADGAYVGLGLGVDFTRNFNMSVVYTNHIYFSDYGWTDDNDFYYDVNRADTLMLGAEVRF